MFRTTSKAKAIAIAAVASLLLLAASVNHFTQAQPKPTPKPATLKDAVERVNNNQIRAKAGFKLILEETGWAVEQITSKTARRLEVRVKCGACPGGDCRPRLNGTCAPRRACTSSSCFIDPF